VVEIIADYMSGMMSLVGPTRGEREKTPSSVKVLWRVWPFFQFDARPPRAVASKPLPLPAFN
jgi:hypothetical protein